MRRRALVAVVVGLAAIAVVVGVLVSGGGGRPRHPVVAASTRPGALPRSATPEAVIYQGSGPALLDVRKPGGDPGAPAILYARASAAGARFVVTLLGATGQRIDAPIDATGPYAGAVLIDYESQSEGSVTRHIGVAATGPWRIEVRSLSSAPRFATRARGDGDQVLTYTGGAGTATIRHASARGLFAVDLYTDPEDAYSLVTTTGRFVGRRPIPRGTELISVRASGRWSISVASSAGSG